MCICGALPDHDECSFCALPPQEKNANWFDPADYTTPPKPPLPYEGEEPF